MRIHCQTEFSAGLVYCHARNVHPFAYTKFKKVFYLSYA